MVIASHIIITGYGHWLPNDPRGSMSRRVRSPKLAALGVPHHGRRRVQPSVDELRVFHRDAQRHLAHPILWFDAAKRQATAEAFGEVVTACANTCYACAVLSNHAHLVVRRHRASAQAMIEQFKQASAERLRQEVDIPDDHPIWSDVPYRKFLDSPEAVRRAIAYTNRNPPKSRLSEQEYTFVKPYLGEWSGR